MCTVSWLYNYTVAHPAHFLPPSIEIEMTAVFFYSLTFYSRNAVKHKMQLWLPALSFTSDQHSEHVLKWLSFHLTITVDTGEKARVSVPQEFLGH